MKTPHKHLISWFVEENPFTADRCHLAPAGRPWRGLGPRKGQRSKIGRSLRAMFVSVGEPVWTREAAFKSFQGNKSMLCTHGSLSLTFSHTHGFSSSLLKHRLRLVVFSSLMLFLMASPPEKKEERKKEKRPGVGGKGHGVGANSANGELAPLGGHNCGGEGAALTRTLVFTDRIRLQN